MLNKDTITSMLYNKAAKAIKAVGLSEGIDKKLVDKISVEIGEKYEKTNGSSQAAKSLAKTTATKYDDSAEVKLAIKRILDIKV